MLYRYRNIFLFVCLMVFVSLTVYINMRFVIAVVLAIASVTEGSQPTVDKNKESKFEPQFDWVAMERYRYPSSVKRAVPTTPQPLCIHGCIA
jgi:hypothetical protein